MLEWLGRFTRERKRKMTRSYLSGGEQTTINSTITELFPALAFNTSAKFRSSSELETYIRNLNFTKNLTHILNLQN